MTNLRPSLDTIFTEAVEVTDPAERAEYLVQACGSDLALRRRVEALVAAHFRADRNFLEAAPAVDATAAFSPAIPGSEPGTVIGPYKLREQIGEGGMGLVFVAEQTEPVRRKVALKVIKPGMDNRNVVARFEAERQALAMMDHPNIARVLDAGTTDAGRPYFAMELVRGTPITHFCDAHRLTIRARLGLFLQVCRAVQHAHQKGVIHRDLKPSNVMVALHDVSPVTKVIDFGIAKAVGQTLTEKTVYTGFGQFVGTPLYMSPEQAGESSLDVDTRADIYSLGVLLYELVTGTTPVDPARLRSAGYDEIRRVIREEEPPRPSSRLSTLAAVARSTVADRRGTEPRTLSRQVHGDLDWVAMRCLEKDRERRYDSAGSLAADVQRYLDDEPVEARPPSFAYRVRKWARRHRTLVWSGVALLAAVAALSAAAAAIVWDQKESKEQALQERTAALDERTAALADRTAALEAEAAARAKADSNFAQADANLKIALEALKTLLNHAKDIDKHGDPAQVLWLHQQIVAVLEGAVATYPDEPDYPRRLHKAYEALTTICEQNRAYRLGEVTYGKMAALSEQLQEDHSDKTNVWLGSAAVAESWRGWMLRQCGDHHEAIAAYRRALVCWEKFIVRDPSFADFGGHEIPRIHTFIGELYAETGEDAQAEAAYRTALSLTPPGGGGRAQDVYDSVRASAWAGLGAIHFARGERDAADAAYGHAAAHYRKGGSDSVAFLSDCLDPMFRQPQRAVTLARKLSEGRPRDPDFRRMLAVALARAGDWDGVRQLLRPGKSLAGPLDSVELVILAIALQHRGDSGQARLAFWGGVRWAELHNPRDTQFIRFRAEAAELLGVIAPPPRLVSGPCP